MKLFEINEAKDIVNHINGLLLLFTATKKTNKIIAEYLQELILELQDQDLIDEASEQAGEPVNLDNQVAFLKHIIDIIEELEAPKEEIDKTAN